MPSFRLIPRDERFFDLFVEDAANVLDGARQLETMLRTFDNPDKAAKKIRDTEHRGDDNVGGEAGRYFVEIDRAVLLGVGDELGVVGRRPKLRPALPGWCRALASSARPLW